MATGLKVTLPVAFTDTTLPIIRDDTILTPGSLALHDFSHSANPLASGLPASGSAVPNIAWKESAAVLGTSSPTSASLAGTFSYGGNVGAAGSKGIVERTGKGGIHAIVSQAGSLAAGDHATLALNSAICTYLAANQAHSWYMSIWYRLTRADPSPGSIRAEVASLGIGNSNNNYILMLQSNAIAQQGATALGSNPFANTLGDATGQAAQIAGAGGGGTSSANGRATWGALTGSYNAAQIASENGHWPSFILYRMYVEDLTVSGRTYATVKALDDTARATAFGTGGRYNADTFTAVSTLP